MASIDNTNKAIEQIDNTFSNLQDRYVALQKQETDSGSFSPSNKKIIKLSNNQAIKKGSEVNVGAQSATEFSNYLEASQRFPGLMNQSPGTIHKVVMNSRGSADNLHSGSSNQELDSVDDQAFQIELKNRLGVIPAPQSSLPPEEQDGKRSPKKQSEKRLYEKAVGNPKQQNFDTVGYF